MTRHEEASLGNGATVEVVSRPGVLWALAHDIDTTFFQADKPVSSLHAGEVHPTIANLDHAFASIYGTSSSLVREYP